MAASAAVGDQSKDTGAYVHPEAYIRTDFVPASRTDIGPLKPGYSECRGRFYVPRKHIKTVVLEM